MLYIVHTNFDGKAICGEITLPVGTECTAMSGTIYHNLKAVCKIASYNAYNHFARNNDGNGLKRGELIKTIKDTLSTHIDRWERVENDPVCKQFNEGGDDWIWNCAFYNASIAQLEYIANLVTGENTN